jgi:Cys-tRNA(Pro)/Cys-tRNA(Cys) deacylase
VTQPEDTVAARLLRSRGVRHRLHAHPAARTEAELPLTGLDVDTSAKTLAFALADGTLVLAAIPGRARLRYGNLARALGVSRSALRPMRPGELSDLGMEPGGVTPLCDDPRVRLVLDQTLRVHEVLFCGSGSPEVSVEIAAEDLFSLVSSRVVADLCGGE